MNQTTTTPLSNIRTDVVGSLLRPAHLKQAYAQRDEGKISEEELHRIEDDAIRDAVRLQESLGLDVITDGEYRRLNFQDSFAASVSGFAARHVDLSFMESLSREGKPLQRWDPYHVADGAAISGNNDMFANMHTLIDTQFVIYKDPMSISARQILELATINGARDLGIADRVGSLTPGKRADLILVRTTDLNMAPLGDPVQAIVRSAQPHNVDTVIVDGRILKRGGQMTALDVEKIVREASESMATLRARAAV